jgi:pimeloyl-ACP methyl ester carboxylesterase
VRREPATTADPGERPPLLFVHGLGHGAWCWEHWLDTAAAAGYPAAAVSLRGHADSVRMAM